MHNLEWNNIGAESRYNDAEEFAATEVSKESTFIASNDRAYGEVCQTWEHAAIVAKRHATEYHSCLCPIW